MIIFGIDPGLNGAIAVFNNNKIKVVFNFFDLNYLNSFHNQHKHEE